MKKVKADEQFFNRFKNLQSSIQNLSFLFQNEHAEVSAEDIELWNSMARDVRESLDDLIDEANARMEWNEPPEKFCFVHEDFSDEVYTAKRMSSMFIVEWKEDDGSVSSTVFKEKEVVNNLNNKIWKIV